MIDEHAESHNDAEVGDKPDVGRRGERGGEHGGDGVDGTDSLIALLT